MKFARREDDDISPKPRSNRPNLPEVNLVPDAKFDDPLDLDSSEDEEDEKNSKS
jgi:hypothetical protein